MDHSTASLQQAVEIQGSVLDGQQVGKDSACCKPITLMYNLSVQQGAHAALCLGQLHSNPPPQHTLFKLEGFRVLLQQYQNAMGTAGAAQGPKCS